MSSRRLDKECPISVVDCLESGIRLMGCEAQGTQAHHARFSLRQTLGVNRQSHTLQATNAIPGVRIHYAYEDACSTVLLPVHPEPRNDLQAKGLWQQALKSSLLSPSKN